MTRDAILITPLQDLLLRKVIKFLTIQQATGVGRATIYRWRNGTSCPETDTAEVLIELYNSNDIALDYNGCYRKSVAISAEQAHKYRLV